MFKLTRELDELLLQPFFKTGMDAPCSRAESCVLFKETKVSWYINNYHLHTMISKREFCNTCGMLIEDWHPITKFKDRKLNKKERREFNKQCKEWNYCCPKVRATLKIDKQKGGINVISSKF